MDKDLKTPEEFFREFYVGISNKMPLGEADIVYKAPGIDLPLYRNSKYERFFERPGNDKVHRNSMYSERFRYLKYCVRPLALKKLRYAST